MGTPTIGGDTTGTVEEDSGDIITGDLDDIGFLTGNSDDTWSITITALYGTVTIDPSTGTWSYDLDDTHPAVDALDAGETLDDTFTVLMVDSDTRSDTQVVTITITGVPCFVAGTMIETRKGPVPVENIKAGDRVDTLDSGLQPVIWAGSRKLSSEDFAANPKLRPICISAGSLGYGLPEEDLMVSPQHRIFIESRMVEQVFNERQILVPAKKLIGTPGIYQVEDPAAVTYHHLLLSEHQIVFSNGAPTESLFVGPEAVKSLSLRAQAEISALFPEILRGEQPFTPARPFFDTNKNIRKFSRRLTKKSRKSLSLAQ
ncbi:MAG: calcium-binding protein [Rhodobacteraceae bacterium]|nr:calcium-binding protein [Paracoccaceae bacterium]